MLDDDLTNRRARFSDWLRSPRGKICKLTIAWVGALALVYIFAYAGFRHRKFLVYSTGVVKETGEHWHEILPGHDIRANSIGKIKNRINPVVHVIYRPLIAFELFIRS